MANKMNHVQFARIISKVLNAKKNDKCPVAKMKAEKQAIEKASGCFKT